MACAGVTPRLETRVKRQSPAPVAGLYVSEQKALAGGLSKFVTNSLAIGLSQSWLRKLNFPSPSRARERALSFYSPPRAREALAKVANK